jgi:hypothetical protein
MKCDCLRRCLQSCPQPKHVHLATAVVDGVLTTPDEVYVLQALVETLEDKVAKANVEKESWRSKHIQLHEEKIAAENSVEAHNTRANRLQKQVSGKQRQGYQVRAGTPCMANPIQPYLI